MFTEIPNAAPARAADAVTSLAAPEAQAALPKVVALNDGMPAGETPRIVEEVVIQEVSIDGMCGVY